MINKHVRNEPNMFTYKFVIMNYCNNKYCLWLSKHIVTTLLISLVAVFTFIYYFFQQNIGEFFILFSFFFCTDISRLGWFVIWQLLISGLEVSIGSIKYSLWLFFNALLIILSRLFLQTQTTGCYYLLYAQFLSFLMMHKPYIYIKIKNLQLNDTHFYFIGMIQTLGICQNFLDIPVVILGNVVVKLVHKLFSCCHKPKVSILNDPDGIGAELNIQEEEVNWSLFLILFVLFARKKNM